MSIFNATAPSGGGLEYEEGTFTHGNTSISGKAITFTNAHSTAPTLIYVGDTQAQGAISDSYSHLQVYWYANIEALGFYPINSSSSTGTDCQLLFGLEWKKKSTPYMQSSVTRAQNTGTYANYMPTSTGFTVAPHYSSMRGYTSTHTYKWIAIWL